MDSAVPAVRRFVRGAIDGVPEPVAHRAMLVASELATNVVVHAKCPFTMGVEVDGPLLRLEVTDRGVGIPEVQPPQPETSLHGRGLQIVDGLADRWGTVFQPFDTDKTVWAELVVDLANVSS